MKVCLIEPPKFVSLTNPVSTIAMPPLGLLYVASNLRRAGIKPTVIDAQGSDLQHYYSFRNMRLRGLEFKEIIRRIPKDSDVIGLGCMFSALWPVVRELVREIKCQFPEIPIILGGEHGTGGPQMALEQSPLSAVVMGEGEETTVELVKSLVQKKDLSQCLGIAFRNGSIQINSPRKRIIAIDDIAWPAWDLCDLEAYIALNQPHGSSQGRFISMLATRGCPYQCTFCTSPQMWTTKWIPRSVGLLVDEIQNYYENLQIRDFQFEDLTAIVRRDWILDFCSEIQKRQLQITFQLPSGTRSEVIDEEVAQALKAAGCHEFAFAPESGDPRILKAIKKRVNLDRMYQAAGAAMKAGINVGCFFIIGFPEDDGLSIWRTYKAILKCAWLGFTNVNLNAYSPQPNTESFNQLVTDGVITDLSDDYLMSLFTFQDFGYLKTSYNKKFSNFQITCLVLFGVLLFYLGYFFFRPKRILQLFTDFFRPQSANKSTKMAKSVMGDLWRILVQKFLPSKAKSV